MFSGVLEYVSDVRSLIPWIASHFKTCIVTYECAQPRTGILGRMREKLGRGQLGWVNHFTESEFMALFAAGGFQVTDRATWGDDDPGQIFVFRLRSS